MKSLLSKTTIILITILFLYSCSSDNDSGSTAPDKEPKSNPNPNKKTTYTNDVKAIIDTHCLSCHNIPLANQAKFAMRNYTEVMVGVKKGLVDNVAVSINNVMPPDGRLPKELVDIILDWEADGFLE